MFGRVTHTSEANMVIEPSFLGFLELETFAIIIAKLDIHLIVFTEVYCVVKALQCRSV